MNIFETDHIMKNKLPKTVLCSNVKWEDPIQITLLKSNYGSFGFSILDRLDIFREGGICIYRVLSNSSASIDHGLKKGDKILEIEHIPTGKLSKSEAINIIKSAKNSLTLVIQKYSFIDDEIEEDKSKPNRKAEISKSEMVEKYGHLGGEIIFKTIPNPKCGLGVKLIGKNKEESKCGVFINQIFEESPLTGTFSADDEIIQINDIIFADQNHVVAAGIIKSIQDELWHVVGLRKHTPCPKVTKNKRSVQFSVDPPNSVANGMVRNSDLCIHFPSNNRKSGLKVIGGIDTNLGGVLIIDIHPDGAAFIDGRLKIGDQILKYCGIDLSFLSCENSTNFLNRVRKDYTFTIFRVDDEKEKYEIKSASIKLSKERKVGISIENRKNSPGTYVTHIEPIHCNVNLRIGDWITSIGDEDVSELNDQQLLDKLKKINQTVKIEVARLPIYKTRKKVKL